MQQNARDLGMAHRTAAVTWVRGGEDEGDYWYRSRARVDDRPGQELSISGSTCWASAWAGARRISARRSSVDNAGARCRLGNVLVEFLPPTDNGTPELTGTDWGGRSASTVRGWTRYGQSGCARGRGGRYRGPSRHLLLGQGLPPSGPLRHRDRAAGVAAAGRRRTPPSGSPRRADVVKLGRD